MKIYAVGGCIRDELLGLTPKDFDFCVVGATPQELCEWKTDLKQVGADFPVFIDGDGTEFALARTERKVHSGYNGFVVDYNTEITLEEDLGRRDLTINAMAREVDYNPDTNTWEDIGEIIDPYHGQADLYEGILRHTTNDFKEDPVRVLRVARFRARYGFDVAKETTDLISNMAQMGELHHLTAERVFMELDKAVCEKYPDLFFHTLNDYTLGIIFPEFARLSTDLLRVAGLRRMDRLSRWTALFFGEISDVTLTHIKVPKNIRTAIQDAKDMASSLSEFAQCQSPDERAECLVNTVIKLKAHQQDTRLMDVVRFMPITSNQQLMHFADLAMAVFNVLDVLDLSSVTSDSTLKGAAIGAAVHNARVEAIAKILP